MATYGYCRVSTARQVEDGESLDVQQRVITGAAMALGHSLTHIYVEQGVSGTVPLHTRPAGSLLLGVVKAGDTIIATKLDRMFRSALDGLNVVQELQRRGVHLILQDMQGDVTLGGMSKLMFTIMAAFAEAERDRIRERIQEVKADQAQRGRYLGGIVPFGHAVSDDGQLVEIPGQIAQVDRMRALRGSGLSYRAIAQALGADGVPISHMGVKRLLAGAVP